MQCHLGTYCADPSGGFRLQFPCALHVQFRWWKCRSARVADIINLYHTGYTDTEHIVDSQWGGLSSLTLISSLILRLVYTGLIVALIFRLRSAICLRTTSADFLSYKRQLDYNWGFILVENLLLCLWFVWYFWSNKLADGSLYEYVGIIFI